MGEGILKESVPEAHTDYIIAIISEEYGSILSIMIILIFLYISFRIVKNCSNEEDKLIKISLCGLATLLIFQTFIHVGVNTSLIPTTGMTLPFLVRWIFVSWKCNTCWSNIELYEKQEFPKWLKEIEY